VKHFLSLLNFRGPYESPEDELELVGPLPHSSLV
jgi:hypothetical protein